jgi:hypothetical protein
MPSISIRGVEPIASRIVALDLRVVVTLPPVPGNTSSPQYVRVERP